MFDDRNGSTLECSALPLTLTAAVRWLQGPDSMPSYNCNRINLLTPHGKQDEMEIVLGEAKKTRE